ncbi:putative disease resistance protein RGA4 [Dioscorea cayenensis subsp. rotundata]|uniref:Disease resistance protein RGA4 n=1 Tax=Dioscorea cayennensis subsp. rotundata TaxID=55577 RepID=A0AB40BNL3_DIOCR|nr:putative disease resistance protein RGA4 [Dioscorea cayenensis subsp. rotundata]
MGGLGKTTLAQLVYRDEEVQKHFQSHIWVCVLDDFDMPKALLWKYHTSASGKSMMIRTWKSFNVRLRKELGQKRYLLVLDDVLNEDFRKWDALRNMLLDGGEGSGVPKPPKLVEIGEKIVEKCQGLPLAILVMGSIMHDKSEEEDHDIEEVELIQLWMAHGFVASQKGNDMEVEGREIFSKVEKPTSFTNNRKLPKLPKSITYMNSLRHLIFDPLDFKALPAGLSQLQNLKTLTRYTVGDDAENNIGQLNPFGKLALDNLERVQNADDARKADMGNKQLIQTLILSWIKFGWINDDENCLMENAEEVLEALKPPSGVKKLVVRCYPGKQFPMWIEEMQQFQYLHHIELSECRECKQLPPFEILPTLTYLIISSINGIKRILNNSRAVDMAANGMPPLPMFDGEDYGAWSIMMRTTCFSSQDLWDLIDKGIPEGEDEARMKEHKKRDSKALYLI